MTAVINPPILTKKKSYEQWKVETLAGTEITDVSREKQAITVALLLPEIMSAKSLKKCLEN